MLAGEKPVWGEGWVYPVPDLLTQAGRFPAVATQEFSSRHHGVDIMLSRSGVSPSGSTVIMAGFEPNQKAADGATTDVHHSGRWFAPTGLWILAARAGKVWSGPPTNNGIMVVIDHGPPWATFYGHLETC